MSYECTHCNDTGSLSKDLSGDLDCPYCGVAIERAQLERWAIANGVRCNDIGSLWLIYQHGQMTPKKKVNINDQFTVTLTLCGAQTRNAYYAWMREHSPKFAPALSREGDQLTAPLWELMQVFGREIVAGHEIPFKDAAMVPVARRS